MKALGHVSWCAAGAAAVGLLTYGAVGSLGLQAQSEYVAVAKAPCGPGSQPEGGLQGQTTSAERFSAPRAYNCNVELVGQYVGEGASFGGAAFDTCAYIVQSDNTGLQHRGTVVVDASDPRKPKAAAYLDSPGLIDANETLQQVNGARKLLAAASPYYIEGDKRTAHRTDNDFEVYDVSNCRKPVLKGKLNLLNLRSHGGWFAPDGRTFYLTSYTGNANPNPKEPADQRWRNPGIDAVIPIDVSDPTRPREILRWSIPKEVGSAHQISVSPDGNRTYLSLSGTQIGMNTPEAFGIVTLDTSDVQARKSNPQLRVISRMLWKDAGTTNQGSLQVRINGRPYLVATSPGTGADRFGPPQKPCAPGRTTYGYAPLIDLRDERNPTLASRLILEGSLPSNCAEVTKDPSITGQFGPLFCGVDDPMDTRIVACGWAQSGLRVFDVRNPSRPREIAYDKPPKTLGVPKPGSINAWSAPKSTERLDTVSRVIAVRRDKGEVWFISNDNGFQIVRFTDAFRATEKTLF